MKNVVIPSFETAPTDAEESAAPVRVKSKRRVLAASIALAAVVTAGTSCEPSPHNSASAAKKTPVASPSLTPLHEHTEVPTNPTTSPKELPLNQNFCTTAIKRAVASQAGLEDASKVFCEEVPGGVAGGESAHFVTPNGQSVYINVQPDKNHQSFNSFYKDKSAMQWGINHYLYPAATVEDDGSAESKVRFKGNLLEVLQTGSKANATNNQLLTETIAHEVIGGGDADGN